MTWMGATASWQDVHLLRSWLPLRAYGDYLRYLVRTRSVGTVLTFHDATAYQLLPAVACTPVVSPLSGAAFVPAVADIVHMTEDFRPASFVHLSDSAAQGGWVDVTFVPSQLLQVRACLQPLAWSACSEILGWNVSVCCFVYVALLRLGQDELRRRRSCAVDGRTLPVARLHGCNDLTQFGPRDRSADAVCTTLTEGTGVDMPASVPLVVFVGRMEEVKRPGTWGCSGHLPEGGGVVSQSAAIRNPAIARRKMKRPNTCCSSRACCQGAWLPSQRHCLTLGWTSG